MNLIDRSDVMNNVRLFNRIDSLTDQQRRDALIWLSGYSSIETLDRAIDYVTKQHTL